MPIQLFIHSIITAPHSPLLAWQAIPPSFRWFTLSQLLQFAQQILIPWHGVLWYLP